MYFLGSKGIVTLCIIMIYFDLETRMTEESKWLIISNTMHNIVKSTLA